MKVGVLDVYLTINFQLSSMEVLCEEKNNSIS